MAANIEQSNQFENMQEILEEYECPVCFNPMVAPIRTCVQGHNLCDRCNSKLEKCPVCRGKLLGARNFGMENIFKKLTVPCQYTTKGCTIRVKGVMLDNHERNCSYNITICPLKAIHNCGWKGPASNTINHCLEKHAANIFTTNRMNLVYPRFQDGFLLRPAEAGDAYHLLTQAHGELFKCVCDFNTSTGWMTWSLVCMNPNANARQFFFEVLFRNVENPSQGRPLHGRSICQGMDYETFQVSKLQCDVEVLRSLSGSRGMYYTISIYKFEGVIQELEQLPSRPICNDIPEVSSFSVPRPSLYLDINDPALRDSRSFLQEIVESEQN